MTTSIDRDEMGRIVREVWLEWARAQPSPKKSWLVSYDDLSEEDKEVDRRIGAHLHWIGRLHQEQVHEDELTRLQDIETAAMRYRSIVEYIMNNLDTRTAESDAAGTNTTVDYWLGFRDAVSQIAFQFTLIDDAIAAQPASAEEATDDR